MYVGYLKGCTVYADLNGDLVYDEGEPMSTTGDFGGWSLTVEETAQARAWPDPLKLVVTPGAGCVDRSTNLSLSTKYPVAAGCEMISVLANLKYRFTVRYMSEGMSEADATSAAMSAIANSLGLTDLPSGFDVCTFDPLEQLWNGQVDSARRRLQATTSLPPAVLADFFALNSKLITLVSGVASVTGFEDANAFETSADAILENVVSQLTKHSAEVANGTASAGDPVEIDTAALVAAAEAAANVTLGTSLAAALADTTAKTAEYVANATATSVATASSPSDALTTIATVGVVGQTEAPAVGALLEDARAGGSSDLSSFPQVADLSTSLVEASTPEALAEQAAAVTVPTPEQAPSPSPPPSPSQPIGIFRLPPTSPPLAPTGLITPPTNSNVKGSEANSSAWAALVLLLPILCLGYLCFRYTGNVGLWFKYRFSHSNPICLLLYVPKEVRAEMRRCVPHSARSEHKVCTSPRHPLPHPFSSRAQEPSPRLRWSVLWRPQCARRRRQFQQNEVHFICDQGFGRSGQ